MSLSSCHQMRSYRFSAEATAMNSQVLDQLFDQLAREQFTNKLLFSTLHTMAERLAPIIEAMGRARPDWLPGSEHRIKESRTRRVAAWPGHSLVVLDPRLMLATDVVPC